MTSYNHPDRKQIPSLGRPISLKLPQIESIRLDNGLQVFLIPDPTQEVTRMDFVFEAGSARQDKKLLAAAVNQILIEGTPRHSSLEIAGLLDFHGAYLGQFVDKDLAGLRLYSLTKYYDRLLPLMVEILTEAIFPEEELRIFDDRRKQEYQVNIQKVRYQASLEFNKLLFGTHSPYGQVLELEDFGKLKREQLLGFYNKNYSAEGFYGILSGKIDESLLDKLNATLGSAWKGQNQTVKAHKVMIESHPQQQKLIHKTDALQSALRLGCLSINKQDADYPKFSLLNTVLGGYFGSRLMSSLREDKGYTYGIHSVIQHFRDASYFAIATEVNARHTSAALKEISKQIDIIRSEKISAKELDTVKNYVYGSVLRDFDGPFAQADRFMKSRQLNIPFEAYKQNLDEMMQCTSEDLLMTAVKYLNPNQMKTLVVGNTTELIE